ncbi:hypothetical protein H8K33_01980 [Undibacterium amnicola]|uniref:Uncharacterized protein n=1 Tax=Undibacterium amnicola TaxID=1834038 RepID=A0ABR6XLG1_9BURK|nr:hypothetical protein [Undibacterium amnicola]MBC3830270.1 hypothetical protein [Undibacterium amnicola]
MKLNDLKSNVMLTSLVRKMPNLTSNKALELLKNNPEKYITPQQLADLARSVHVEILTVV